MTDFLYISIIIISLFCAGYIFRRNTNETYIESERDIEQGILEEEVVQIEESKSLNQSDKNYSQIKQIIGKNMKDFFNRKLTFEFEYVFGTLDKNKDNVVSADEIQAKLRENGCKETVVNIVPKIIKKVSMDNKDVLTRNDLKNLIE